MFGSYNRTKSAFAISIVSLASVISLTPALAQRTKMPAAEYSRCILYDQNTNRIHNNCTDALQVHWSSNGRTFNNGVTIPGGDYYEGGSRPTGGFVACLDLPQNRFDFDSGQCFYWQ